VAFGSLSPDRVSTCRGQLWELADRVRCAVGKCMRRRIRTSSAQRPLRYPGLGPLPVMGRVRGGWAGASDAPLGRSSLSGRAFEPQRGPRARPPSARREHLRRVCWAPCASIRCSVDGCVGVAGTSSVERAVRVPLREASRAISARPCVCRFGSDGPSAFAGALRERRQNGAARKPHQSGPVGQDKSLLIWCLSVGKRGRMPRCKHRSATH